MTLACLGISSKKRCLHRLFIYHFKAHTISNKLVSKVFAQKKGEKSYDSYKYVFQFRRFQVKSPLSYMVLQTRYMVLQTPLLKLYGAPNSSIKLYGPPNSSIMLYGAPNYSIKLYGPPNSSIKLYGAPNSSLSYMVLQTPH